MSEIVFIAVFAFLLGRFIYHVIEIWRMTRSVSIYDEAAYIINSPDLFLNTEKESD